MQIHEYKHGLYSSVLNLNLNHIKKSCHFLEKTIELIPTEKEYEYNGGIGPKTTNKFRYYNVLMHPLSGLSSLYFSIQKMFRKCAAEHLATETDEHYIQCWLNVYHRDEQSFIDWHGHWHFNMRAWHGFFCVDVEPDSYTSYTWDNGINVLNIKSINNLLVLGLSNGDQHRSSEWNYEYPRITIAFDIVPRKSILSSLNNDFDCSDEDMKIKYAKIMNKWIPI